MSNATDQTILELNAVDTINDAMVSVLVDTTDHTMDPTGTDLKYTMSQLNTYIQSKAFGPWVSNASTSSELLAAALVGGWINVTGAITLTSNLVLGANTLIYVNQSAGGSLYFNGAQIDTKNFVIWLKTDSCLAGNNAIIYTPSGINKPFITSTGSLPISIIYVDAVWFQNNGNYANTSFCESFAQIFINGMTLIAGNADNAGLSIGYPGATVNGLRLGVLAPNSTNALVVDDGCASLFNIYIVNPGGVSGQLVSIGQNNPVSNMQLSRQATSGVIFNILNKGQIYGLESIDGTAVNITMDGANPVLEGSNLAIGSVTINNTATNPKIISSNATGAFTNNSSTYQGAANSGTIVNTGNSLSISPYQGAVDGVGALALHYINFGAAYSAGKTYDESTANITETADINILPAGQLLAQIGQGFTWDLSNYSVVGSLAADSETTGANSLTINLSDSSSTFKWGNSTAGLPISNFDSLSTLVINASGGVLQNISTNANCYLHCAGTMLIHDAILLLPNASNGGVKTDNYTQLSGIEFTGGGVSCDTALTCEGGSVRDFVIDGAFTDNAKIVVSNSDTIYDGGSINIVTNGEFEICGKASKILSVNPAGFLIVTAKPSTDANGNTSISDSTIDQLSLPSAATRIKISNCTIGLLDFATDNTTECEFVNCTILNNSPIYGIATFTNCHFVAGFEPQVGATISLVNSTSAVAITYPVGADARRRQANDQNIGNESDLAYETVTGTSVSMQPNTVYITTNSALTTLTLPINFPVNSVIEVVGNGTGDWRIAQNAGQQINSHATQTTSGTSGYLESTTQGQSAKLIATAANTTLRTINLEGNITIN